VTPVFPSNEEIILDIFCILTWTHLGMMLDVGSSKCNEISKAVVIHGSLMGTDRVCLCMSPLLLKDTQWFLG